MEGGGGKIFKKKKNKKKEKGGGGGGGGGGESARETCRELSETFYNTIKNKKQEKISIEY